MSHEPQPSLPAFNNRAVTYRLVQDAGRTCILYRRPDDRPYPDDVLEAARVMRDHPCEQLAAIYDVQPTRITAEYLADFVPLSKAGITSARFNLFGSAPRRFKRRHIRPEVRDVADHFDSLLSQLRAVGGYFQARGLWHDDVLPQNIMWDRVQHRMKLIDIQAFCPRPCVDAGTRPLYNRGRARGVFRGDYSLDVGYVRSVFLQDLAPWPVILLRKLGIGVIK
jgi:hypothetical protein